MMTERLLQRVDQLIEVGDAALRTCKLVGYFEYVDGGEMKGFRTASLSFIGRVFGEKHSYFTEFSANTKDNAPADAERGIGILRAIREEIAAGWLFTIKGLVVAEVFADYMGMGEYLLDSGYKDPAAVVAGSTLEEHLRQLCMKNGIPTTRQKDGKDVPLKADQLNSDLTKAGVYTMLDHKLVTAWLALRNKAAHGEYDEYNADQVKGMMTGIAEFMARVAV